MIYQFIGSMVFRRQQDWEQRKNARIMFWTVVVALMLALALTAAIKLLNSAKH